MKIIIPMTGRSLRFKKAGISIPKQFLEIGSKTVLEHIIKMFPGEKDINLIVNDDDYNNENYNIHFKKLEKYKIVSIPFQKSGPGGALLASGLLETNKAVLINYCDFSNLWDWEQLKSFIGNNNLDGLIPAYKGLHPHSIYGNDYAFLKTFKGDVLEIKEKESFTSQKINEYASTGTYYFKTGSLAKFYLSKIFDSNNLINGEAYVSTAYQDMIDDGLRVKYFHIENFFQWGTPEDYTEFNYNIEEVKNVIDNKKIDCNKINLVIPAGGEGKRFKDKGYKKSKLLLDVDGKYLIHRILESFENQETTKLLIKESSNNLLDTIDNLNMEIDILKISTKTKSQAHSTLELVKSIDNNLPILVHSADCILDKEINFQEVDYDVLVVTKSNYRRSHKFYSNYGWINTDDDKIRSLSIKQKPTNSNSSVITGIFIFRNKDTYTELFEKTELKLADDKEMHIDFLIETALNSGMKVKEVRTQKSVMMGYPLEYELYKYMELAHKSLL